MPMLFAGGIAELVFEGVINAGGIASEWVYPYNCESASFFLRAPFLLLYPSHLQLSHL